jgi:hypothetical protein
VDGCYISGKVKSVLISLEGGFGERMGKFWQVGKFGRRIMQVGPRYGLAHGESCAFSKMKRGRQRNGNGEVWGMGNEDAHLVGSLSRIHTSINRFSLGTCIQRAFH